MSERAIHYRRPGGGYPCGVGRRWSSQTITSGPMSVVTCRACLRIEPLYRKVDLMSALKQSIEAARAARVGGGE